MLLFGTVLATKIDGEKGYVKLATSAKEPEEIFVSYGHMTEGRTKYLEGFSEGDRVVLSCTKGEKVYFGNDLPKRWGLVEDTERKLKKEPDWDSYISELQNAKLLGVLPEDTSEETTEEAALKNLWAIKKVAPEDPLVAAIDGLFYPPTAAFLGIIRFPGTSKAGNPTGSITVDKGKYETVIFNRVKYEPKDGDLVEMILGSPVTFTFDSGKSRTYRQALVVHRISQETPEAEIS